MIVYSKSNGLNDSKIGRLETPIKMIIEHESELITKNASIATSLFNIEKSNRFGETIIGGNEFDVFTATEEGGAAESDSMRDTYHKFIEHIQFMKEFIISAEMMEDANFGIASDAKRRAENFTRAYYKTINRICESALVNATSASATFARAELDLTSPDGLPLSSRAPIRRQMAERLSPTTTTATSSQAVTYRTESPPPLSLRKASTSFP